MSDEIDDFYEDFCAWVNEREPGTRRHMTLEEWAREYVRHIEQTEELQ